MRIAKIYLTSILIIGLIFTTVPNLYADETSEVILKLLIKKGIISQKEVDEIKAEIAKEEPKVPETVEERVATLEEKVEKKGFLSAKGVDFQLGGELELEFVNAGGDASDDKAHFQLDKFVLQPKLKIGDNLKMDAQVYFQESSTSLNEIHAKLFNFLLEDLWIDVGLYERWLKSHHNRKTEGYPLLGTAFYRDDALTFTWGGELEPFYWMLSVGQGYELDDKQVAEDSASVSKIIHDDHATSGLSDALEYGINLGLRHKFEEMGEIDLLAFYYADELSSADISFLESNLSGFANANNVTQDDDKRRLGVGLKYNLGNSTFYGGYIDAEDGKLDRDSWFLEAAHHFKFDTTRDWFTGIEPVISYSDYAVDFTKTFATPLSWDREKWILAAIIDLYKNTKLKIEYYINDEKTGGGDVDNDGFLTQLEIKF